MCFFWGGGVCLHGSFCDVCQGCADSRVVYMHVLAHVLMCAKALLTRLPCFPVCVLVCLQWVFAFSACTCGCVHAHLLSCAVPRLSVCVYACERAHQCVHLWMCARPPAELRCPQAKRACMHVYVHVSACISFVDVCACTFARPPVQLCCPQAKRACMHVYVRVSACISFVDACACTFARPPAELRSPQAVPSSAGVQSIDEGSHVGSAAAHHRQPARACKHTAQT